MSSIVFLNGDFCKEEDAKVSIFGSWVSFW